MSTQLNPYRPPTVPAEKVITEPVSAYRTSVFRTALGFMGGARFASAAQLAVKLLFLSDTGIWRQIPLRELGGMFLLYYPLEALVRSIVYIAIVALFLWKRPLQRPMLWLVPLAAGVSCTLSCDLLRELQVLLLPVGLPRPVTAAIAICDQFVFSQVILAICTVVIQRCRERRRAAVQ